MTPTTETHAEEDIRHTYGPKLVTSLPGPNARAVVEADDRLISPSYTRSYPMVAKRGRGVRVEDVDGNEFLDFAAGIAVTSTGHCHPEVVTAIQRQAAELIHMSGTDFYYENMITLAERLSKLAPMKGPHRFYYGNSGAEAVECALKIARYHTGRQHIIAFLGAFHGRTMGALSLTASKPQQKRRFSPLVPGVTHVRYPYAYRGCSGGPQEEEAFALGCARYIEDKLFKTTLAPEEVAAIFVEPIQGEGGYVPAPKIFLQELRKICDRHGILLVADEVQSGAGRTGQWWAIQDSGVEPDIVCIAKGIASGMPLSICMTRAEIMDWKPGSHASTFGGNPVAIAAALATMDVLEREGIANAAKRGGEILERLRTWKEKHPVVGDVRGRGLMIGVEFVKDQKTREVAPALRDRIVDLCFERGLLVLGCGETSIRLAPPLIVNEHEAKIALDIFEQSVAIAAKEM
ncbi:MULTISPECIES: acetyl ornithine aminotransferase family protein [Acidobacterium]|uniref:Putative 4-aminobutyrate aminotransferase n=1 Tax=Acidobacterium capsulatum (strain ATCC 51196 / DSM 11244 / BCRC 80197 / JCM 7670 / NBRC 15755 / NCIMB 13165 / 161) TaxID=240015 RepID=C1F9Q8_ACIC5|nr:MULTISPECIES: acetyl ornithine aminotransferase family protein [Acidobacterium]ACO32211.1 putative 4-aminobutyrate aminotransferase [Acidobacterium capsulatum ATCC 51196]HCT62261.1 acetyl ornithine aminotransferase family protein [Acidobacterium sp.]